MISRQMKLQSNPVLKAIRSARRPLHIVGPEDDDDLVAVVHDLEGLVARVKALQDAPGQPAPLLTVKECAERVNCSPSTIYANQHRLSFIVKVRGSIRIDPVKLQKAIDQGEV